MKAKTILLHPGIITTLFLASFIFIIHQVSKRRIRPEQSVAEAYTPYITAFTGGEISRDASITVRFVDEMVKTGNVNMEFEGINNILSFEPSIYGRAKWVDTRTLQYTPNYSLSTDQVYNATLNLSSLIPAIEDSLKQFKFSFKTKKQLYKVELSSPVTLNPSQPQWQKIEGTVTCNDTESKYRIEEFFSAYDGNTRLKINWDPSGDAKIFNFTIDSLVRKNNKYAVKVQWESYDKNFSGSKDISIEALSQFSFIQAVNKSYPEQLITLEFSDPIKKDQDFENLIKADSIELSYQTDNNKLYLYPKTLVIGQLQIHIDKRIQNIEGKSLQTNESTEITFIETSPQISALNNGTIIPSASTLPFAFEAVNLNAVDIRVMKIMEKNIPQFLQINQLDESRELRRVGSIVIQKKISLGKNKKLNLKKWNKHLIDLKQLFQPEAGAIYQIAVGFKKSYSLYSCEDTTSDAGDMIKTPENWDEPGYDEEFSYWDAYYQYDEEYEDTDNPCKRSYYNSQRAIFKNILASNLGLVAKMGSEGYMFIAATDLLTTNPISNTTIEVYDYQQKLIASGKTNNGVLTVKPTGKPYLVIGKTGKERGYLRVDNNSSLSLSRFDIGGKEYKKGVKGFIYAERDVWRPGDSMYVNFILEDKLKTLPVKHPVIMELYNPEQELVQRIVNTNPFNNFYKFHTCTSDNAPTGNYTIKILAGGSVFEKTVKIETILPNRLKINIDFGTNALMQSEKEIKGTMSVKWLHGATAKNLKADVSMMIRECPTTFKTFKDYIFTDPTRKFEPERKEIFNGTVNDSGRAEVKTTIALEGTAPGMLKADFRTKVFEPGGNFSSDYHSITFHPYDTYVGIKTPKGDNTRNMLLTDKDNTVSIVTLNTEGNTVSGKKLRVELYKISWKWWWDSSEEEDFSYNGKMYSTPIQTDTVTTGANGMTTWKLRVNYPDWGRYMVRVCDEGGHCTGKILYIDWPGWAGRSQQENPDGAKMLPFSCDKEVYKTGEKITLNIPTGFAGRALLTLESGTKVIGNHWIEATKGMTQFSFTAAPSMAPSVYAYVTLLQPHAQTVNDLPLRMYGILPIRVEDPQTHLHPAITMADELEPEQNVTVSIKEQNGKAMTYTIAIVDEGLLDLTRFKTPDPWTNFNERQALDVKTWDLYDRVADANSINVKNLLSIGGDGSFNKMDRTKSNRFKPVVMFIGPFTIESGASKTHRIKLPNYIGSVKTMVIAANNGAYGSAEKVTPVKKPLMVLGTLPRVLGPNEELNFPVTIFAMEKNIKNVSVKIESNELIAINGAKESSILFAEPGDKIISFPLKVTSQTGIGKVKVTATCGKEKAVYETEISIRTPNPKVVNTTDAILEAGRVSKQTIQPVGIKGTNTTIIEVSSIPPLNLGKRLEYLIHYPYGCVEQTTSSVFPQLCLNKLMTLPDNKKLLIDKNIKAGIGRLKLFQKTDGSLSYWPGSGETNEWGTCYAGHFMLEAEKLGFTLPYGFKDKWKEYIKKTVKSYTGNDELTQAYKLYLLALNGTPEVGIMNRMKEDNVSSSIARWYLAAAYHMAGQYAAAKEIMPKEAINLKDYKELNNSFGSDERDKAIILQTLTIMGEKEKASKLMQELAHSLNGNEFMNTQAIAYSLVAISKYSIKNNLNSPLKFAYKLDNGKWNEIITSTPIWKAQFNWNEATSVEIKNLNNGIVYLKTSNQGIPLEGDKTDTASNLILTVQYMTMDGKKLNPDGILQGTDFKAEVSITNTGKRGNYEQIVLNQLFPSGWEIHNLRMSNSTISNSPSDYQDYRDDRVYTFFSLTENETKTYTILLNASYEGKFYLPTLSSEAMYDNSINARIHGGWIRVIKNNTSL